MHSQSQSSHPILVDLHMPPVDLSEGSGPRPRNDAPLLVQGTASPDGIVGLGFVAASGSGGTGSDGDTDACGETAERFLQKAPELAREAADAIVRGDAATLVASARSLREMTTGMDARRLEAEARRVELLGGDGDLEGARGALSDLEVELKTLLATLSSVATP